MQGVLSSKRRHVKWAALGVSMGLVLAAASATVLAAAPQKGAGAAVRAGQVAPVPYGWQALGLTDEQIAKINEIRQKSDEQALPIRTQLLEKRQELATALRAATPDAAKVKALVAQINELQGQLQQIRIQAQLDVRAVLTDEQRAKLGAFGFGWFGGFGPRGRGFGPGHGPCHGYGWDGYGPRGRGMGPGYGMMGPGWGW